MKNACQHGLAARATSNSKLSISKPEKHEFKEASGNDVSVISSFSSFEFVSGSRSDFGIPNLNRTLYSAAHFIRDRVRYEIRADEVELAEADLGRCDVL